MSPSSARSQFVAALVLLTIGTTACGEPAVDPTQTPAPTVASQDGRAPATTFATPEAEALAWVASELDRYAEYATQVATAVTWCRLARDLMREPQGDEAFEQCEAAFTGRLALDQGAASVMANDAGKAARGQDGPCRGALTALARAAAELDEGVGAVRASPTTYLVDDGLARRLDAAAATSPGLAQQTAQYCLGAP